MKTQKLAKFIGSNRVLVFTLLLFIAEASRLALTSRFPMAYDESYHFGLIQFFSHHLNPIISSQPSSSYRFGAIIQDPSFLYHYLLSFPYRLIVYFTNSLEIQAIGLRFVNVAFATVNLLILRKLLRLINLSDALVNVMLLAFALTPLVTVVSAQINYDNLLMPLVSLCVYETIKITKELQQRVFNTTRLLALLCLCLFSSLVKFSFLPVFIAVAAILTWKIFVYWHHDVTGLIVEAKKNFSGISKYMKLLLLMSCVLWGFLFTRFYIVNLVRYHNPEPQCSQVLSVLDCKHYYAWNNNYTEQQYNRIHHPAIGKMNILGYFAYWFYINLFDLFGATTPVTGVYHASVAYLSIVLSLGALAAACTVINLKKIRQENNDLLTLGVVSLVYILFLWGRNYYDYRQLGQPVAIHGRYLLPILLYFYVVLVLGLRQALKGRHAHALAVKLCLASIVAFSFTYYGGYEQYISQVTPTYGHLGPYNDFILSSR